MEKLDMGTTISKFQTGFTCMAAGLALRSWQRHPPEVEKTPNDPNQGWTNLVSSERTKDDLWQLIVRQFSPEAKTKYNPAKKMAVYRTYMVRRHLRVNLKVAPGYKIGIVCIRKGIHWCWKPRFNYRFDKGCLWLVTMPTYPHWKPGDKPNDKIIILKIQTRDGKADKWDSFRWWLANPPSARFETSQRRSLPVVRAAKLIFLRDTDGDEVDQKKFIERFWWSWYASCTSCIYNRSFWCNIYGRRAFLYKCWDFVWPLCGGFYRYNPQRRQLGTQRQRTQHS